MSDALQDWLPDDLLDREIARSAVAGAIAEWSSRWSARGALRIEGWRQEPARVRDVGWRDFGGLSLHCGGRGLSRLNALALDSPLVSSDLTDRDRMLVSMFADAMIEDLAQAICGILRLPRDTAPARPDDKGVLATLSDGRDELASLWLPRGALLALCRRALPNASPGASVVRRSIALAPTSIAVEASLGSVALSLAEIQGLALGDVLVLDRTLLEAVDLGVAGDNKPFARGALTQIAGQVAVIVQAL